MQQVTVQIKYKITNMSLILGTNIVYKFSIIIRLFVQQNDLQSFEKEKKQTPNYIVLKSNCMVSGLLMSE